MSVSDLSSPSVCCSAMLQLCWPPAGFPTVFERDCKTNLLGTLLENIDSWPCPNKKLQAGSGHETCNRQKHAADHAWLTAQLQ